MTGQQSAIACKGHQARGKIAAAKIPPVYSNHHQSNVPMTPASVPTASEFNAAMMMECTPKSYGRRSLS